MQGAVKLVNMCECCCRDIAVMLTLEVKQALVYRKNKMDQ